MKIITVFKRLDSKNEKFDLIAIQSKLVERTTNLIDCSKIIERKTKANFNKKFGKIPIDNLFWYSSIEVDSYDALVVILNK